MAGNGNRRETRRYERRKVLIAELLERRDGREFFMDFFRVSHCLPGAENPYKGNALSTSFSCGEMNIGQQVLVWVVESSLEGYLKMLKQESDYARSAAGADAAADTDPSALAELDR